MRLRRTRLRSASEEGAAAVEFALVVPLLLTLLFGIIEFGAAYNAQILVTNAAREAARELSVEDGASTGSATATADAVLAPIGLTVKTNPSPFSVSGTAVNPGGRLCGTGQELTVTLKVDRSTLTGLFGPFELTGKAVRLCAG
ncbi:TadE/TadG family type IV pilus assembly protein [Arenivirga flava]|uniref:TadE-like domain-containing protein n=1 Tax=Arenivirga flava TaxID=1930060 RepID=A0AA37UUL4_9MICO|nr:TadE family protein [Arenivirga flava]GMA28822.1 hypothetical protein GCM10025874_20750 [Arenivirga flava]